MGTSESMALGQRLAVLLRSLEFWGVVATFAAVVVALWASWRAVTAEHRVNKARASMMNRRARTAVDGLIDSVRLTKGDVPFVFLEDSKPREYVTVGTYSELVEQFHNEIKGMLLESYYLKSEERFMLNHLHRSLTHLLVYTAEQGDYPENATAGLVHTLEKSKAVLDKYDLKRSPWWRRINARLDTWRTARHERRGKSVSSKIEYEQESTMKENDSLSIREIVLKRYEIDYAYHHQKEIMAWTASSVYFIFSVAFFAYMAENALRDPLKTVATIVLSLVYVCLFTFLNSQFKSRWDTLDRISRWQIGFSERWEQLTDSQAYKHLTEISLDERKSKPLFLKRRKGWLIFLLFLLAPISYPIFIFCPNCIEARYRTEIPTYTLLTAFFVGQLLFIWLRAGT